MIKNFLLSIFLLLIPSCFWGNTVYRPQVSVAGFIPLSGSGRDIYNFNPGWRYYKGDMERAETVELDDSDWEVVATPHSVELMPAEATQLSRPCLVSEMVCNSCCYSWETGFYPF